MFLCGRDGCGTFVDNLFDREMLYFLVARGMGGMQLGPAFHSKTSMSTKEYDSNEHQKACVIFIIINENYNMGLNPEPINRVIIQLILKIRSLLKKRCLTISTVKQALTN